MKNINKVVLMGYLSEDPKKRETKNGGLIVAITLPTTEKYRDKSGEEISSTNFHKLVFFNKFAEIAYKYLKKGSPVYIEGKLQTRKYTDKDNIDRYITEIIVLDLNMLDSGRTFMEDRQNTETTIDDADIPF